MNGRIRGWGLGTFASLVVAQACSGQSINELGNVNRAGGAGSSGSESSAGKGGNPAGFSGIGDAGAAGSVGPAPMAGGASASGGNGGDAGASKGGSDHGAGDTGNPPQVINGDAGAAGSGPEGELICAKCQVVTEQKSVRGIAVDSQRVFWIDYGTTDDLGNYEDNGRLLARNLEGGAIAVLASALPGPEKIGVSSAYVYLFVSQRSEPGFPNGVLRIPLAGGAPETVVPLPASASAGELPFASAGGYVFLNFSGAIQRVDEVTHPPVVESFVAAQGIDRMSSDGSALYYQTDGAVWAKALDGSSPVKVAVQGSEGHFDAVFGEFLYGQEQSDRIYLRRVPKTGGAWKRLMISNSTRGWNHLVVNSDSYVNDEGSGWQRRIVQYSATNPGKGQILAQENFPLYQSGSEWLAFASSRLGIFFSDAEGLYFLPPMAP